MSVPTARARRSRVRLTRSERREQLIDVARALFAERGLEGTSVEEIAAHAGVSKPVVYEHFGGKEGLYAVVVDREVRSLHDAIRTAITTPRANPRALIELGTLALLDYIDDSPNGFRILSRDSSATSPEGSFATILSDIASRVEDLLAGEFTKRSFDPATAPLYSQMLVGPVSYTHLDVYKRQVLEHGLDGLRDQRRHRQHREFGDVHTVRNLSLIHI